MNANDNKKSASLWTQRLFKQTSAWKTAPPGKIYFAHRYHEEHAVLAQFPFSALFADLDNQQINLESTRSIPQGFFEHQSVLSKGSPLTVASNHNCDVKGMLTPIKGLDIASGVTLSTQFTVLNSYNETSDTKTIQLGRLNGQAFDYLPGQYITLSVVIEGKEYKRSYSLASSPTHPGILEITVKRDANGGVVSNWLNDKLTIGDTLNVKGPFGKFSCAKNTPKKILFLAAGSGIVPIMSMLRWLADTKACVDVMLLLSFQTLYDIIYSEELNLIAAHHKNIRLFITLTKELYAPSQLPRLTGRVNQNMLAGLVPDLTERTVYLCGPDVFMNTCKQNLLKLKLPAKQLICENFTVGVPAKPGDLQHDRSLSSKIGSYQIQFAKSGKSVDADGAMTLLELAEKSGVNIGHECRAGSCGECMVKCLNGKVDMTERAEIDDIDRNKGWVYACCAYPSSNVVLDI
ncbi:iron-sulfur cluster-binding domain-containing protein [Methyloglobulus sp.]|uniref:flavin reductase family protein n=1 Tax=Methyloglobulus sp. TaxID=2518622 RepID=UPI0032B81E81